MKSVFSALLVSICIFASIEASAEPAKTTKKEAARKPNQVETCGISVGKAQALVSASGVAENEEAFLKASEEAVVECRKSTVGWKGVDKFLSSGVRLCKQAANQQSQLFHGTCLLKVTDAIAFMTGT